MLDQAEQLRKRIAGSRVKESKHTIAIASGSEGVGKSNFTLNFAIKLMQQNKRVLIFDLNNGKGTIDRLLEVPPLFTLSHLFSDGKTIWDIVEQGPISLSYLAGGPGVKEAFELDEFKLEYFQSQFEELNNSYDYILFNMGSEGKENQIKFMTAADEVFIVTTPAPRSITSAYALIKNLLTKEVEFPISILFNRSSSERISDESRFRLQEVIQRFLQAEVHYLGSVPEDRTVIRSVIQRKPFTIQYPKCPASKALSNIVYNYVNFSEKNIHYHREFSFKLREIISKETRL
ncbi:nucleotide-binding protein [Halobacillus sp. K22]|uniref:nucleotide-binding protein n=1 Tax=Halobacillus sp. K22 TaxID=3457431 RepID=UPI003FCDD95E